MTTPPYLSKAIEYLDNWFEIQMLQDKNTPGLSVAISYRGDVIYKNAWGFANVENNEKITPEHLFRIASHSKTFTATAIMQLVEVGKMSLDDPVGEYLDFLNTNPDKRVSCITIRQLLSHSSGMVRDGKDSNFWSLRNPFPSKEAIVQELSKEPLAIEYNTRFKYSNYAYGLLGWIIEEVSGLCFADYMQKNILDPLKLTNVTTEHNAETGNIVTGYSNVTPSGEQIPLNSTSQTEGLLGATGFCANPETLCKFYTAIMPGSGQLLKDKSKQEMLQKHIPVPDMPKETHYGLGFVCEEYGSRTLNGHSGGMPGHTSRSLFDKQEGIVVSIMTNSLAGQSANLQTGVWHIIDFYKEHHIDNNPLQNYHGCFYSLWSLNHFVPAKDKIYVSEPKALKPFNKCSELAQIKGHVFSPPIESGYGNYGENVTFTMDKDDTVSSIQYAGYELVPKARFLELMQDLKNDSANLSEGF